MGAPGAQRHAWLTATVPVLALACAPSSATVHTVHTVHTVQPSDGIGDACTPRGPMRTLTGKLIVRPFGKGSDGAVLVARGGEQWVLSYRASGPLLELRGRRVEITGRACDKDGEAIAGPHFATTTVGLTP